MNSRRVVVTGMGVVSPVGLRVPAVWDNLIRGCSGIRPITLFDTSGLDVHIAGEVLDFDPGNYMPVKEARRMDRFAQYAVAALQEAMETSRLEVNAENAFDIGVVVGCGAGGIGTYTQEFEVLYDKGPRRITPFLIPAITVDAASVQVGLRTGARGPNFAVASACATGADAVGQAFETIRRGYAEVMITGGVEAAVTPIGVAAFDRMRALSRRNEDPPAASRPFDGDRDGFVMSDGGAVLILEELTHALRRGAEPLAEVLGYGATSDAAHLAAPDVEGASAAHCMNLAIRRAGLEPEQISYINAHGTSTPSGDLAETAAIKQVFGRYAYQLPVSSTKSMTGHLLGGAGAFEAVVCVQALRTGIIPPTINHCSPDPSCDLDYIPNTARSIEVQTVLSNSFGFGGHNVSLVFGSVHF